VIDDAQEDALTKSVRVFVGDIAKINIADVHFAEITQVHRPESIAGFIAAGCSVIPHAPPQRNNHARIGRQRPRHKGFRDAEPALAKVPLETLSQTPAGRVSIPSLHAQQPVDDPRRFARKANARAAAHSLVSARTKPALPPSRRSIRCAIKQSHHRSGVKLQGANVWP
jgi:hypothetical protein